MIANGGFQRRSLVQDALDFGACGLVSMARPLLANPDLVELFRRGVAAPERPCTLCNRCAIRTTRYPLGCYEPRRFGSLEETEREIMEWSARPDVAEPLSWGPAGADDHGRPALVPGPGTARPAVNARCQLGRRSRSSGC